MPGRHDAPGSTGRRWVPTAFDAFVAATPATSLIAALGLAGGGYLDGREDIAACGAVVGAFGLAVERMQARRVRVRLRRARADHRNDMQEVTRLLHQMQRDLADLRTDLDGVRTERDAVRAELLATQRAAVPVSAGASQLPAPAEPQVEILAESPAEPLTETPRPRLPLNLILPGQVRSPIATGGIPLLAPGPSVPVRPVPERRSARPGHFDPALRDNRNDVTQPLPVLTAELADALVYAAMAEADAAELTHSLEAAPTLYVVRRGKHVA